MANNDIHSVQWLEISHDTSHLARFGPSPSWGSSDCQALYKELETAANEVAMCGG